ncbi:NAD(P)-binding protein [Marasmius fiardii PR-910]|nr:NAD(P)-binding protein [Marasmius fiardii PR-910]
MSSSLHADVPYSRPATPGPHASQVGFVGLGAMGYFMARNLATRRPQTTMNPNPPVLVWNRSSEKAEKLLKEVGEDRIRIAQSPEQIAQECDIIVSCLANDAIVKNTYEKFAKALTNKPPMKHKTFIESSTIFPTLAGELDTLISAIPRTNLVTCPVFGTPSVADAAQLLIILSGEYRSKQEAAYLLVPAVGRKAIDLGENLEKAPTFKLIGNSLILGTLEVLGEGFTLGHKAGISSNLVHSLVKEILPAPGTVRYAERIAHDNFDGTVGFAIDGGIKDASHIRRLTAELNAPMPVIDIAHQHLITARAINTAQKEQGHPAFETLDWSSIAAGSRVAAGLHPFDVKQGTIEPTPED